MGTKPLSLVIPAYNEASTIGPVLHELETYLRHYRPSGGWEIVVVNDGSRDATMHELTALRQGRPWLRVVDLHSHQGRGAALRAGMEAAEGDIIVSLDADLSYAPYHIARLVEAMEREQADLVLASAYGHGGTVKNVPFKRLLLSRLGNGLLTFMFGGNVTVVTCLVRAYRRAFFTGVDLHSSDKEIHLEILHKTRLLGGKIVEVPADLYWREQKRFKTPSKAAAMRRSTLKVKKTSSSHLFFALLSRPGLIFWIPGYILTTVSCIILCVIAASIILRLPESPSLYQEVRHSMINASPSWFTMVISFVLGIQFFTLGFITTQTKRVYEDTYRTMNAIYREMKRKE